MKKLGMIGGTSWHSTIDYYRYINQITNDRLGTKVNPELLLHSINIEMMHSGDWDIITLKFKEVARSLEKRGAEGIILCANSTHLMYTELSSEVNIPIIHIADAIADEAKRLKLSKLGLIGTKPTMSQGFISDRLKNIHDIEVICPSNNNIDKIHNIVVNELVQGVFSVDARHSILKEMDLLYQQGAEAIILGCTEFPILLKDIKYQIPLLDTTWLHAKMSVDFILSI